jgi:hypothetical protein
MSAATSTATRHQPSDNTIFIAYDDLNTNCDILDRHNIYDEYSFITNIYDVL